MQEDPQRLAAKEMALQTADRRVNKGREQIAMLNSGVSFFGKSNASEAKTNDANFFNSPTHASNN